MPIKIKQCQGRCGSSKRHDEFWRDSQQPDGRMTRCIECVKQERAERREAKARGEMVPAVSEELRRERSERAKRLHEDGRFGGADFGKLASHPKRKPRIADTLLDYARDHPDLLIRAFDANARSKNKSQRMRALEFIANLEQSDEKTKAALRGAGKAPDEMTQEELEDFVAQALAAKIRDGEIDLSGIVTVPESDIVEVEAA